MMINYQIPKPKEARQFRRAFQDKFLDKSLPDYRSVMGHFDFYGGNGRLGYMWEVIKPYHILSFSKVLEILPAISEVFVIWDRPLKDTSTALQKSRVIKLSGSDLALSLEKQQWGKDELSFLPNDVYITNSELDFQITLTHEYLKGFGRICLTSFENMDFGISPAFQELFAGYHPMVVE